MELELLTVKDAANQTGLSKQTIWRAIANGDLKAYKKGERQNYIFSPDLKTWHETIAPKPRAKRSPKNTEFELHPAWPACTDGGWYWHCPEHDVHGNADDIEEATHIAHAHQMFRVSAEKHYCMIHMFEVK